MPLTEETAAFLRDYPQVYFACHRRHVRDAVSRRRLSLNQAGILDHLDDVEPTHLHTLAAHMGVTASTMSLNVDRLERAGYVRRSRDCDDARRVELRLTDTGAQLKQRQQTLEPERVRTLLLRLPKSQRERALDGLRLLAAAAKKMNEGPTSFGRSHPAGSWGGRGGSSGHK